MYPGLPTYRNGSLQIGTIDQECSARVVTRRGQPYGAWVDDTTFNAQHDLAYYVDLTVAKYAPLGQTVFVCVPPGEPHHHWPAPIVSVYEAYIFGMGCPPDAWLPLPHFDAYCVQRRWPGTHGRKAPTPAQYSWLLQMVLKNRPHHVFEF